MEVDIVEVLIAVFLTLVMIFGPGYVQDLKRRRNYNAWLKKNRGIQ